MEEIHTSNDTMTSKNTSCFKRSTRRYIKRKCDNNFVYDDSTTLANQQNKTNSYNDSARPGGISEKNDEQNKKTTTSQTITKQHKLINNEDAALKSPAEKSVTCADIKLKGNNLKVSQEHGDSDNQSDTLGQIKTVKEDTHGSFLSKVELKSPKHDQEKGSSGHDNIGTIEKQWKLKSDGTFESLDKADTAAVELDKSKTGNLTDKPKCKTRRKEGTLASTDSEVVVDTENKSELVIDLNRDEAVDKSQTKVQTEHPKPTVLKYACKKCDARFSSVAERKTHKNKEHLATFKCTFEGCTRTFSQPSYRKKHVDMVHEKIRKHQCTVCQGTFVNSSALKNHMYSYHTDISEKTVFTCETCSKQFYRKTNLDKHQTVHTGEKKFKCSFKDCGKTFRLSGNLSKHERTHSNTKPYRCEECGSSFSRKAYLESHMYKHTGVKEFVCDICEKSFSQKGNLTVHMAIHNSDKRTIKCDKCPQLFNFKSNLSAHVKKYHESNDKAVATEKRYFHRKKKQKSILRKPSIIEKTEAHCVPILSLNSSNDNQNDITISFKHADRNSVHSANTKDGNANNTKTIYSDIFRRFCMPVAAPRPVEKNIECTEDDSDLLCQEVQNQSTTTHLPQPDSNLDPAGLTKSHSMETSVNLPKSDSSVPVSDTPNTINNPSTATRNNDSQEEHAEIPLEPADTIVTGSVNLVAEENTPLSIPGSTIDSNKSYPQTIVSVVEVDNYEEIVTNEIAETSLPREQSTSTNNITTLDNPTAETVVNITEALSSDLVTSESNSVLQQPDNGQCYESYIVSEDDITNVVIEEGGASTNVDSIDATEQCTTTDGTVINVIKDAGDSNSDYVLTIIEIAQDTTD